MGLGSNRCVSSVLLCAATGEDQPASHGFCWPQLKLRLRIMVPCFGDFCFFPQSQVKWSCLRPPATDLQRGEGCTLFGNKQNIYF